ncbi:MAG TPA: carboxypeptidase-like regulatory domain-containing protein [Terriglobia bacterium]|jgi:hypothetical protein
MKRVTILAGISAGVCIALTGVYRAQDASKKALTAAIDGVVTKTSGEPLPDAHVTVTPIPNGMPQMAITAADGHYSLSDLPPGQYLLKVERSLFVRDRRDTTPRMVNLTAGEHLPVSVQLTPTAVVTGRILDEERQPLQGARVEAMRYRYRDGSRVLSVEGQAASDDRGEYRIFNLPPDSYYIRATIPGRLPQVPVYYPGVIDSLDAAGIKAGAGAEIAAINVPVLTSATFSLRFHIVSALPLTALPAATVTVLQWHRGSLESVNVQTTSPGNGLYILSGLLPGSYEIFAALRSAYGGTNIMQTAHLPIEINNGDQDAGALALRPGNTMVGRLAVPAVITGPLRFNAVTVALRPMDGMPAILSASTRSPGGGIADDGSFAIPNVNPGKFRVTITGLSGNVYVTAVRCNGVDVTDSGMVLDGSALGPLEVMLGGPESVGSIEGVVHDANDKPVPEAVVALVPSPERRKNPSAFRTVNTTQLGTFSMSGVSPGTYTVLAWDDLEPGAYEDPDFLKDFEYRGTKITVERGSRDVLDTVHVIQMP